MMTRRSAAPLALPALAALAILAGCADTRSGYPSLAPRPIERAMMQAEAAAPLPPAAPPPLAPSADIAEILASATAADTAFKAALEKARPQIEAGRGAGEGSEAWVVAQQAYSDVEVARAPIGDALAELDRRRQAAVAAGRGGEEAAAAEATLQVQALDEAERALLAGLVAA
ncbi:hypothetical protein [Rhizorhabdus argentea]|uniref:hypothetical protein n=1 Tax=Rhizorhabdus argentea TaxID=1387174 RepID=UPI0030EF0C00